MPYSSLTVEARRAVTKPRLPVLAFIAAPLVALGTLPAACGGNGGLALQEYFQQIDVIIEGAEEQGQEANRDFFEALFDPATTEEGQIAATQDFFNSTVPIFGSFVDALDDIDPPGAVEDAHAELVDAGRDLQRLSEDIADQIAAVKSVSELEAVLDAADDTAAEDRFDAACFALQGIADDNGILVNLGCPGE